MKTTRAIIDSRVISCYCPLSVHRQKGVTIDSHRLRPDHGFLAASRTPKMRGPLSRPLQSETLLLSGSPLLSRSQMEKRTTCGFWTISFRSPAAFISSTAVISISGVSSLFIRARRSSSFGPSRISSRAGSVRGPSIKPWT